MLISSAELRVAEPYVVDIQLSIYPSVSWLIPYCSSFL